MFAIVEIRKIIITAAVLLLLLAVTAMAQITNFAGQWEPDIKRSTMSQTQIDSWTTKVKETGKELSIDSLTKNAGGEQSGAMMFSLEGKETTPEIDNGKEERGIATLTATVENGKLILTSTRKINLPSGETTTSTVKEHLELTGEGKRLKAVRRLDSQSGKVTMEIYFTKNKNSFETHANKPDKSSNKSVLAKRGVPREAAYERDYKIYAQ